MNSLDLILRSAHPFDLELETSIGNGSIELSVEELPQSLHFASDCASSVGSASTAGGCVGGSVSSAASVGSMGSIVSSGA